MLEQQYRGRAASIAIILAGSIYYTWVKHTESQRPPASGQGAYERVAMDDVEAGKIGNGNGNGKVDGKP